MPSTRTAHVLRYDFGSVRFCKINRLQALRATQRPHFRMVPHFGHASNTIGKVVTANVHKRAVLFSLTNSFFRVKNIFDYIYHIFIDKNDYNKMIGHNRITQFFINKMDTEWNRFAYTLTRRKNNKIISVAMVTKGLLNKRFSEHVVFWYGFYGASSVFVKRRKHGPRESDDGLLVTSRRGGGWWTFGEKFVLRAQKKRSRRTTASNGNYDRTHRVLVLLFLTKRKFGVFKTIP